MLKRFAPGLAPKEFSFKDPDCKRVFKGTSIADLCTQVRGYRKQNNMEELEYLETIVESYLCSLPAHIGGCEPLPRLKRGLMQTLRGGIAVITSMMYKTFVSQDVADYRSSICKECPLNVFYDKGPFITFSDDLASQVVGDKKSRYHNDLGNCEACSCGLRFKVFYDGAFKLTKKQRKLITEANPKCWML